MKRKDELTVWISCCLFQRTKVGEKSVHESIIIDENIRLENNSIHDDAHLVGKIFVKLTTKFNKL